MGKVKNDRYGDGSVFAAKDGYAVYDAGQNYMGTLKSDGSVARNGASSAAYKDSYLDAAREAVAAGEAQGQEYAPATSGGSGAAMGGGRASEAENALNGIYNAANDARAAALKGAYEGDLADLAQTQTATARNYYDAARTAQAQAAMNRLNLGELLNANGLNTGAVGQAALAQSNVLQSALGGIEQDRASALTALEQQKQKRTAQYRAAVAQALADNELARASALYEQYTQQSKQANALALEEQKNTAAQTTRAAAEQAAAEQSAADAGRSLAQKQVEALVKAGQYPGEALVQQSGYDPAYVSSMAGYYLSKKK